MENRTFLTITLIQFFGSSSSKFFLVIHAAAFVERAWVLYLLEFKNVMSFSVALSSVFISKIFISTFLVIFYKSSSKLKVPLVSKKFIFNMKINLVLWI